MRKIIYGLLIFMLLLTGCALTKRETIEEPANKSRFVTIERTMAWRVCVDRETNVMYSVSGGPYNAGNFTVLVDADGKPLLWKGELP